MQRDASVTLLRQVKVLDTDREQMGRQVAELQTRLSAEDQRDEERAKEMITLKLKLSETETSRNALQKDVRSHGHVFLNMVEAFDDPLSLSRWVPSRGA